MITPDLPLARAITTAVLDQIERSRTISSSGIEEVVYAKLLYANALAGEAPKPSGDPELAEAARGVVDAIIADPVALQVLFATAQAVDTLNATLRRRGV